ncbi:MAG: hypothetical protein ACN4GW_09415 [Desulforhopalus sp.]
MIPVSQCKYKFFVSILLVVSLSLIGCAANTMVPLDRQIQLSEGADTQGSYKTGQVTVVYSYKRTGDNMVLSGTVSHYGGFDSLNVRALFTDAGGQILQRDLIYSTGYRKGRGHKGGSDFEENLKVPPGAVGFAFSYSSQPRSSSR